MGDHVRRANIQNPLMALIKSSPEQDAGSRPSPSPSLQGHTTWDVFSETREQT